MRYGIGAALERTGWNVRTEAEATAALRISQAGYAAPEVSYQWPVGKYKLDFAWVDRRIALEIDGPMHFAPHQAAMDRVRDHYLRSLGWIVFHIDADEPLAGDQIDEQLLAVLAMIRAAS